MATCPPNDHPRMLNFFIGTLAFISFAILSNVYGDIDELPPIPGRSIK